MTVVWHLLSFDDIQLLLLIILVRLRGLEPPQLASQAPQACVSTISPQSHILAGTAGFEPAKLLRTSFGD